MLAQFHCQAFQLGEKDDFVAFFPLELYFCLLSMLAKNGFYSEGLKNGMLCHVNRIEAYVYISYLWLYLSRNVVFALSINVRCKDKDHLFIPHQPHSQIACDTFLFCQWLSRA